MKLDIKLGAVLIFSILALGISSKQVFASSTASLDQITQLSVGSSVVDTTIAGNYLYATSIDDTLLRDHLLMQFILMGHGELRFLVIMPMLLHQMGIVLFLLIYRIQLFLLLKMYFLMRLTL